MCQNFIQSLKPIFSFKYSVGCNEHLFRLFDPYGTLSCSIRKCCHDCYKHVLVTIYGILKAESMKINIYRAFKGFQVCKVHGDQLVPPAHKALEVKLDRKEIQEKM